MSTEHLLPTFARIDLAFDHGEGCWLTATNGDRYLDFTSGVAVNALGHAHPKIVEAVTAQAHKAIHVSNLFRVPEQEKLADRLCAASFADYAFFCNSGAEAMEGAIKTARKYHAVNGAPERFRIITFEGAFHGRTLATLAAGGQKKYLEGFGPVVEGFDQVPFGDLEAVKKAIGPQTAAILIEPIQGEGGVRVPDNQFLRALRALCDQHGMLLVFDEVQTGMGRSGELFAHQRTGVTPDIMALAKALGGGFPIGACLATGKDAAKGHDRLAPMARPSAAIRSQRAVGNAVLDVDAGGRAFSIARSARRKSCSSNGWRRLKDRYPTVIAEVRGEGLLIGLRCGGAEWRPCHGTLRNEKLLTVAAGDNVVRLRAAARSSSEEEMSATRSAMIDRACARRRQKRLSPQKQRAAG